MPTQAPDFQAWWIALIGSIPVISFWYKTRMDLKNDILRAHKKAAKCHEEFESLRLLVANQALDNARIFATKSSLQSIADDLKDDAKEREARITKQLESIFGILNNLGNL